MMAVPLAPMASIATQDDQGTALTPVWSDRELQKVGSSEGPGRLSACTV